jgi:hypothetical protein
MIEVLWIGIKGPVSPIVSWRALRGDRDQCRLQRHWTEHCIVRDHSHANANTNPDSKLHTDSHANTIAYTGDFEHYCGGDAEPLV